MPPASSEEPLAGSVGKPALPAASLFACLHHWAETTPQARYCTFLDGNAEEIESYTFESMRSRALALAGGLSSRVDLVPGRRVLLAYPPGLEMIVAFLACVRLNLIPVPVPAPGALRPENSLERIHHIARDCAADVVLSSTSNAEWYRCGAERREEDTSELHWIATEDLRGAADSLPAPSTEVLFLQYTSGSTRRPRGVVVSHANVLHNARAHVRHGSVGVSWLPQYHDLGLIGYYLHPLVLGASVYGLSPLDFLRRPATWLRAITQVRATSSAAPNFAFEYCLREDKLPTSALTDIDLSCLKVLGCGAEPVNPATFSRFWERFKEYGLRRDALIAGYGLAENTLVVTSGGQRILALDRAALKGGSVTIVDDCGDPDAQRRFVSCGRSIKGTELRIVDPQTRVEADANRVGEIWVRGDSTCSGYWNQSDLSVATFGATLEGGDPQASFLRTGDMGFVHDSELYVCGRLKDLLIVRGANFYPEDIESVVAEALGSEPGTIAAFETETGCGELAVVVEMPTYAAVPDSIPVVRALRQRCGLEPQTILYVPPRAISRTTSGKLARAATQQRWHQGKLRVLACYTRPEIATTDGGGDLMARFAPLLAQFGIVGNERSTFAEAGFDSLAFVSLLETTVRLLRESNDLGLADNLGIPLLQHVVIADFFSLLTTALNGPPEARERVRDTLLSGLSCAANREAAQMRADANYSPPEGSTPLASIVPSGAADGILLTGGSGFFGPHLLAALLGRTSCPIHVLMRAASREAALGRLRALLTQAGLLTPEVLDALPRRIHIVLGDLAQPSLGLTPMRLAQLSSRVVRVVHNAALVNYVLDYSSMRPPNVEGTRELLHFCAAGGGKPFHFISSTIIFGWTAQARLLETDANEAMAELDFGYAQTKWVAEQLVFAAGRRGLPIRVYRPSFITASRHAFDGPGDVVTRLLSFMINEGIAVESINQLSLIPADVAANNIAALVAAPASSTATTFHVTTDEYYNMRDVTEHLSQFYGYQFRYYEIPRFVAELRRRCTPEKSLYPLLDFFERSRDRVGRMQHKRYDNRNYRAAGAHIPGWQAHPSMAETLGYIVAAMRRDGRISAAMPFATVQ